MTLAFTARRGARTRFLAGLLVLMTLILGLLVTGAGTAHAATLAAPVATASTIDSGADATTQCGGGSSADSPLLLINRWQTSTSTFQSYHKGLSLSNIGGIGDVLGDGVRQYVAGSGFVGGGNAMYQLAKDVVTNASTACVFNKVAVSMDTMVWSFGKMLVSPGGYIIIAGFLLGFIIYKTSRLTTGRITTGAYAKDLLVRVATFVMILTMIGGTVGGGAKQTVANADSAAAAGTSTGDVALGKLSPGWWMAKVANGTSQAITSVASITVVDQDSVVPGKKGTDHGDVNTYVRTLHDRFVGAYKGDGGVLKGSAAIPLILDSMWAQTAIPVWSKAQYGDADGAQDLGSYVSAHYLDWASSRVTPKVATTSDVGTSGGTGGIDWSAGSVPIWNAIVGDAAKYAKPNSAAVNPRANTQNVALSTNASMFAWASCIPQGDLTTADGWGVRSNGPWNHKDFDVAEVKAACAAWWTQPAGTEDGQWNAKGSAFDLGQNTDTVTKRMDGEKQGLDFALAVQSLDATTAAASIAPAAIYGVTSLFVFIVFAVIGLVVLGGKIATGGMAALLFLTALKIFFTGNAGASTKKWLKQAVGVTILANAAVLLVSVIALLTSLIASISQTFFTAGSNGHIAMIGIAPILAIVMVHLIFTKGLKMSSPLSPGGAKEWAKSGGDLTRMVGAGAAGGLVAGAMSKMGQRGKGFAADKAKSAADKMTGGAAGKIGGWNSSDAALAPKSENGSVGVGGRSKPVKTDRNGDGIPDEWVNPDAPKTWTGADGKPLDATTAALAEEMDLNGNVADDVLRQAAVKAQQERWEADHLAQIKEQRGLQNTLSGTMGQAAREEADRLAYELAAGQTAFDKGNTAHLGDAVSEEALAGTASQLRTDAEAAHEQMIAQRQAAEVLAGIGQTADPAAESVKKMSRAQLSDELAAARRFEDERAEVLAGTASQDVITKHRALLEAHGQNFDKSMAAARLRDADPEVKRMRDEREAKRAAADKRDRFKAKVGDLARGHVTDRDDRWGKAANVGAKVTGAVGAAALLTTVAAPAALVVGTGAIAGRLATKAALHKSNKAEQTQAVEKIDARRKGEAAEATATMRRDQADAVFNEQLKRVQEDRSQAEAQAAAAAAPSRPVQPTEQEAQE